MKQMLRKKDVWVLVAALIGAFTCVTLIQFISGRIDGVASMVFLLAVFFVSMYTDGYWWGVAGSVISVLAVNFAFRTPYFAFNFTIPENIFSGVVMLVVSFMTSTLTTRIKKQEQLRMESEAEKMRANLLRAVSHDLRTPLTSIYGACSTVIDNYDSLGREQKIKLLSEACADAQWLNRMVENLLSVTRIDADGVAIQKTPTVLEELVDTVLVRFQKLHPGVPVEVKLPDDFIVIPMDSMLIQQVLTNLLENAVLHAKGMDPPDAAGVHAGAAGGVRNYRQRLRHPERAAQDPLHRHDPDAGYLVGRQARHGHRAVGVRGHHQSPRRRDKGREHARRGYDHPVLAGDRRSGYGGNRG